jgi:endonuclease IV
MATELERAKQLKAQYVIIHIGHRMESPVDKAVDTVSRGINEALAKSNKFSGGFVGKYSRTGV